MTVRNTSKAAFISLEESGARSTKRLQILNFIRKNPNCSRADISAGMGFYVDHKGRTIPNIPLQTVCGRVNELLIDVAISSQAARKIAQRGVA